MLSSQLITCDLMLNSNIVALGLIMTVAALLSMNIVPIDLQESPNTFMEVAMCSSLGVYVIVGVFWLWAFKENLIVF